MALETLKCMGHIGGFEVTNATPGWAWEEKVLVDLKSNIIAFKIQDGPIKENGVNGCQVDTLIETAMVIIDGLNGKFPSDHNIDAIDQLAGALWALQERKKDREKRQVEGTNQV